MEWQYEVPMSYDNKSYNGQCLCFYGTKNDCYPTALKRRRKSIERTTTILVISK